MGQPAETDEASLTRQLSRKRRQTQARLLDAALDAFAERGFHGTSVEDVCERAGFSRGAFYSNFSSKEELFLALYDRQATRILDTFGEQAPTGEGTLDEVVADLVAAIPRDRRWYLVSTEFALHAVRNPEAGAAFAAARATVRAGFAARVDEVLERHGRELTVPVDDLVRWLFAVHDGGLAQSYVEQDRLGPNDLTRQVAPLLVDAVTRPAGRGAERRSGRRPD
jgi:AcrR family transcriptional regulator